ncbi:putative transcriptional regulatory protein, AraC family [Bradyrhizobium sp. ORS 285]|uniref:AraC family transcriptional regulator n=1 Tax=Bradyrhizobium sp. ORS 285 TaxID=115808 RepID=UPI0002407E17|nr:helix-turn-helix domain-containing protein [Bradyrhizobium sp. ORS 285]CCD85004.1 putative transcriptional regulatory protein, AraC family [Bradyrhizobium sp. ORS 285]SMX62233.1 putative transcriptional regulatory protein, AraC family [Bradyrhizobium sp. ORS 285]
MPLEHLDLALRAAAIALLAVLAVSLWRDLGKRSVGRLAVALALGSAAHAATFNIGGSAAPSLASAPLIALATADIVVLWLFCRALFDDGFAPRWRHGLIWLAVFGFSLISCLVLGPAEHARIVIVANNLLALAIVGLTLAQTIRSWSADLVEGRRRVRAFVVIAALCYGGVNALLQMFAAGHGPSELANVVNAAMFLAVVGAVALMLLKVGASDVFAPEAPHDSVSVPEPVAAAPPAGNRKLVDALLRLMADERIYRQENVTIGMLATRLSIPEYRLRRLINGELGYRNFNTFLNNHRIEEAKAALADPAQAEVPVITIAMDAGFQSLGPFNRAFKAATGVTPTEFRRMRLAAA